jgi:hypothetical protein
MAMRRRSPVRDLEVLRRINARPGAAIDIALATLFDLQRRGLVRQFALGVWRVTDKGLDALHDWLAGPRMGGN